ncbi:MAG: hypothetical protein N2047_03800 [Meiothermus sp.]|nr:hypothetical protein [Meiothermus sp.]
MSRYLILLLLLPALFGCNELGRLTAPPPSPERAPVLRILLMNESPEGRNDTCEDDGRFLLHTIGEQPGWYAFFVGKRPDQKSAKGLLMRHRPRREEGWTALSCVHLKPGHHIFYYYKSSPDPAEAWWVARRTVEAEFQPDGSYTFRFTPAVVYREPTAESPLFFSDRLDENGKPRLDRKRVGPRLVAHNPYCLQAGAKWFLGRPLNGGLNPSSPPAPPALYLAMDAQGVETVYVDGMAQFTAYAGSPSTIALPPREAPYEVVVLQSTPEDWDSHYPRDSFISWTRVSVRLEEGRLVCQSEPWRWVEIPYIQNAAHPFLLTEEYDPFRWPEGFSFRYHE